MDRDRLGRGGGTDLLRGLARLAVNQVIEHSKAEQSAEQTDREHLSKR